MNTEALRAMRLMKPARSGKIPAIKLYRMLTGATLMEAKEAVESFVTFTDESVKPATKPPPSVRVRIAVAVDIDGNWNSEGWSGRHPHDLKEQALEELAHQTDTNIPTALYWVTADLPIPQAVEVEGEVES